MPADTEKLLSTTEKLVCQMSFSRDTLPPCVSVKKRLIAKRVLKNMQTERVSREWKKKTAFF